MNYDIIGDIHGHADELRHLLSKLGYTELQKEGSTVYAHPEGRMAIFVGDLIDRGPKIRETLQIVKSMVDAGVALCTRGNHEDNAISFWRKNEKGDYERKHNIKNIVQHFATIKAFQNRDEEWQSYLKWFETLPYYHDLPGFRVVHACWPTELTRLITESPKDSIPFIESTLKSTILRGEEVQMPPGIQYADKDGNVRIASRTQWWLDPSELTYREYFEAYVHDLPNLDVAIPDTVLATLGKGYPREEKPVFFGHYWLRGKPILQKDNVCCLDYSIAKGGSLVAYRFDGEKILDNRKFVLVP